MTSFSLLFGERGNCWRFFANYVFLWCSSVVLFLLLPEVRAASEAATASYFFDKAAMSRKCLCVHYTTENRYFLRYHWESLLIQNTLLRPLRWDWKVGFSRMLCIQYFDDILKCIYVKSCSPVDFLIKGKQFLNDHLVYTFLALSFHPSFSSFLF